MRMRLLGAAGVVCVMAGGVPVSAEELLLNYVPASADSILCVNVHKLASDPITSEVLGLPSMGKANMGLKKFTALTGVDWQKDVERVCYARNMAAGEESGALLVQGKYDEKRLLGLMSLADKAVETTTIAGNEKVNTWRDGDGRKYHVFLPDGVQAMAFSRRGMEEVLLAGKQAHKGAEAGYAKGLELLPTEYKSAIAWMRLPTPANMAVGDKKAGSLHINSFVGMADLDGKDLKVSAVALLDSSEDATNVANIANGLVSFMKLQMAEDKKGGEPGFDSKVVSPAWLAEHLSVSIGASANTVRGKLSLPADEFVRHFEKVKGERKAGDWDKEGVAGGYDKKEEIGRHERDLERRQKELSRRAEELDKMRARLAEEESKLKAQMAEDKKDSGDKSKAEPSEAPPAAPKPPSPPAKPQE